MNTTIFLISLSISEAPQECIQLTNNKTLPKMSNYSLSLNKYITKQMLVYSDNNFVLF